MPTTSCGESFHLSAVTHLNDLCIYSNRSGDAEKKSSGFSTSSDRNRPVQSQKRDCMIHVAKTKALVSCCAVTAQLICVFVFAQARSRFSHGVAHNAEVIESFLFMQT